MQRNLDISTLRALVTVVDMAGVTKAANKLNLTQSTVSMQIKRLEETLNMTLVQREGRAMKPTVECEQLLSYARKLLTLNDEAIDRLISHDSIGELRFGCPIDIANPHIPTVLKQFVRDYPQVAVSLVVDDSASLLERYAAGKLDVIVTTEFDVQAGGKCLLTRNLLWTGAINGQAWLRDPLPIAFTQACMFRKPAIQALDAVGLSWSDPVLGPGESFNSGSLACAADLGIRADIEGFLTPGLEPIKDTNNRLPRLPRYQINLYSAEGANQEIASVFARLVENAFSQQHTANQIESMVV